MDGACRCAPGFTGTHCEHFDACALKDCGSHGSCAAGQCICAPGFTGEGCEVDACAGVECGAHGTCVAGQCICSGSFGGARCLNDLCYGVTCGAEEVCVEGSCYKCSADELQAAVVASATCANHDGDENDHSCYTQHTQSHVSAACAVCADPSGDECSFVSCFPAVMGTRGSSSCSASDVEALWSTFGDKWKAGTELAAASDTANGDVWGDTAAGNDWATDLATSLVQAPSPHCFLCGYGSFASATCSADPLPPPPPPPPPPAKEHG